MIDFSSKNFSKSFSKSLAMLLLLAGCASSEPEAPAGPELPLGDPMTADHPFPSSQHIDPATGRLRVPAWVLDPGLPAEADGARALFAKLGEQLGDLDGAGLTATVLVPVRGEYDAASAAESVRVVAVEGGERPSVEVSSAGDHLEIRPVVAWRAGQSYAVVIAGLRSSAGVSCRPSAGMVELLAGDSEERERVLAALAELAVPTDQACVAFTFNVQEHASAHAALRAALDNHATPPRLTIDHVVPATEVQGLEESKYVDRVAYGTYTAPEWRGDDGLFVVDRFSGGAPDVELRIAVSLPKGATGPVPLVIGLHGMGSDIDHTLPQYAEELGEHGFAYATIDGVLHGSRSNGQAPQLAIFDVSDLRKARDAFRQTLSDLYRMRQTMSSGVVVDGVSIAPSGIQWTGGSYGGIFGVMMLAFDEQLEAAHVEGCGGPWSTILWDSSFRVGVKLIFSDQTGLELRDAETLDRALQRFLELGQWLLDVADPAGLAQELARRGRSRMLLQYWVGETTMPNSASRRLESILGLSENQPASDAAGVSGAWGYDVASWGIEPDQDAHGSYWMIPEARAQAIQFLLSHGTELGAPGG